MERLERTNPSQIAKKDMNQSIKDVSKMSLSSNRRNNQASSTMIPQHRRNEDGRISIGAVGGRQQTQIALDTPTTATQNLKTGRDLNDMKAGIESLEINSTTSGSSDIASPQKVSPPSASHKCSSVSDAGHDGSDGLATTRQLLGHRQASTGSSETDTDADAAANEQAQKEQVFEKLGAFVKEHKDAPQEEEEEEEEAPSSRMTPPPEAEISLTLNDMTSASEAVPAAATNNNDAIEEEPRSSRRISFSRLDDVMVSDDGEDNGDDSDDDKSMTLDDLMEMSTNDRASPSSAPTSVPGLIRSSAETTTTTTTTTDYEVSIEAPLREESNSSRRSSAISFECHDSVLFDLLSQEISDNEDDIDPRRNPSFYNESIGAPNVLSRMDQSILAREVSNGRLARDGMHYSFSHGLNLDE